MSGPVVVQLEKDVGRHLRQGHPWAFAKAIAGKPKLAAGTVVDLHEGDRFVARGLWDPGNAIRVRIFARDPHEALDALFWRRRIARAFALRREVLVRAGETTAYRVVHGESDGLPGVVVDRYGDFLVLKLYSAALVPHRPALLDALEREVPGVRGIFGRDELGRDDGDGAGDDEPAEGRVHRGAEPPELLEILEHGAKLYIDVRRGQKTGFFLDQRENRAALRRYAAGREALNCFGYTGGFSVHLALGGARRVETVDVDADALALAKQNFTLNGLDPAAHAFTKQDVFALLAEAKARGRSWDLIVLDPPAFAKSQKAVEAALDGYASLNRAALAVLRPGGILVSCSCTARVTLEEFVGTITQAAYKSNVELQLLELRQQPPDHPMSLAFREGRYLKVAILRRP